MPTALPDIMAYDTSKLEDLGGYKPEGQVNNNTSAVIITSLHGLAGQILQNFEQIKPANQQQKTAKAIAYEEIDLWMNTTWRELATHFGMKLKEGQTVNPAPEHSNAL